MRVKENSTWDPLRTMLGSGKSTAFIECSFGLKTAGIPGHAVFITPHGIEEQREVGGVGRILSSFRTKVAERVNEAQ